VRYWRSPQNSSGQAPATEGPHTEQTFQFRRPNSQYARAIERQDMASERDTNAGRWVHQPPPLTPDNPSHWRNNQFGVKLGAKVNRPMVSGRLTHGGQKCPPHRSGPGSPGVTGNTPPQPAANWKTGRCSGERYYRAEAWELIEPLRRSAVFLRRKTPLDYLLRPPHHGFPDDLFAILFQVMRCHTAPGLTQEAA